MTEWRKQKASTCYNCSWNKRPTFIQAKIKISVNGKHVKEIKIIIQTCFLQWCSENLTKTFTINTACDPTAWVVQMRFLNVVDYGNNISKKTESLFEKHPLTIFNPRVHYLLVAFLLYLIFYKCSINIHCKKDNQAFTCTSGIQSWWNMWLPVWEFIAYLKRQEIYDFKKCMEGLGVWDWHMHTEVYGITGQMGPAA